MPNKFTAKLDALVPTETDYLYGMDLAEISPEMDRLDEDGYYIHLRNEGDGSNWNLRALFWCFIAELSDQDLEECFPECFPPSTKEL